jgi:hypothetical protein
MKGGLFYTTSMMWCSAPGWMAGTRPIKSYVRNDVFCVIFFMENKGANLEVKSLGKQE